MNSATQATVLSDTLQLIRSAKAPVTKRAVAEAYVAKHRKTLAFDWAFEQLQAKGQIKRVQNTPGVDCVDGRYVAAQ